MIKPLLERRKLESRDKARNKPDVGVVDVERVVDVQLGIAHLVEEFGFKHNIAKLFWAIAGVSLLKGRGFDSNSLKIDFFS